MYFLQGGLACHSDTVPKVHHLPLCKRAHAISEPIDGYQHLRVVVPVVRLFLPVRLCLPVPGVLRAWPVAWWLPCLW